MTRAASCPYVGLQPYTEDDRQFFFGREREQRIISSNLYASPLTVVYGPSGVGKSSILRAGVVPYLQSAERTTVVYFNQWQGPSFAEALKADCLKAVAKCTGGPLSVDTSKPLPKFLASLGKQSGSALLILLDQFEEYFLYHPENGGPSNFDGEFASAVNQGQAELGFMISLRDDWLSRLDRFQRRIPNLLGNTYRLDHLNSAAGEDAICKPLEVYKETYSNGGPVLLEDELVREVLAQVRSGKLTLSESQGTGQSKATENADRIETSFLQLVMTRLWEEERKAGSSRLRLSTLKHLGGAQQIVQSHLDDVLSAFSPEQQQICAGMFRYLVTPKGSKIAHETADLVAFAERPAERVKPLLEKLADPNTHLLRRLSQPERYEIFHDVLGPAVLDWRTRYGKEQDKTELAKQAQAEAERKSAKRMGWLSLGLALAAVSALAFVGISYYQYKAKSKAEAEKSKAEAAVIAERKTAEAAASAAKATALTDKAKEDERDADNAKRQADIALAHQLAAVSLTAQSEDPQISVLLALKGLEIARKENVLNALPDTEEALRTALVPRISVSLERPGHDIVTAIAFSPDGKFIATAGADNTLILWDATEKGLGNELFSVGASTCALSPRAVNPGIVFSADARSLACVTGNLAEVFSATDGTLLFKQDLTQNGGTILSPTRVSLGRGGERLLVSSNDATQLWSIPKQSMLAKFSGQFIGWSRDERRLAILSQGSVQIWDVESPQTPVSTIKVQTVPLDGLAFSSDGSRVAVANPRGGWGATLWDVASAQPVGQAGEPDLHLLTCCIAFSPDGSKLSLGALKSDNSEELKSNRITLWDLNAAQPCPLPVKSNFMRMEFTPSGKALILSERQGTMHFLNLDSGAILPWTSRSATSPDGTSMAVPSQKSVILSKEGSERFLFNRNATPNIAVFSPNRRYLAISDTVGQVALWDLIRRTPPVPLKSGIGQMEDISFSAQSDVLAFAGSDGKVYLWSITGGRQLPDSISPRFEGEKKRVLGIAFSPDGKLLALAGEDGSATIWDIYGRAPAMSLPLETNEERMGDVAFTPDGTGLMAVSDKRMLVWNLKSGKVNAVPKHATADVYFNVVYSSDAKYLAATSRKGLKLWSASSDCVRNPVTPDEYTTNCWKLLPYTVNDTSFVWLGAGFSRDGKLISGPARFDPPKPDLEKPPRPPAVPSKQTKNAIGVWETETGKTLFLQTVPDLTNPAFQTSVFSADGSEVYAVASNWTVYRYPLARQSLWKAAQEVTMNQKLTAEDCKRYLHGPCP